LGREFLLSSNGHTVFQTRKEPAADLFQIVTRFRLANMEPASRKGHFADWRR
jgi:hypothetical protein